MRKITLLTSLMLTLVAFTALMPVVKATTTYYLWDGIHFVDGTFIKYPHPDRDYYEISPYSDWNKRGIDLIHDQVNYYKTIAVEMTVTGIATLIGAIVGVQVGGTYGGVIGTAVGLLLGGFITIVAEVYFIDECHCIWWWTSIEFLDWLIVNAFWLGALCITNPSQGFAVILAHWYDCGYLKIGCLLFHDAITEGGGGCPFVSTWDGEGYWLDNNMLPASEYSSGTDVTDYYKIQKPLDIDEGKYSLMISEFENEHSYLDEVRLLAVDHESDVNVAVSPKGEILTYKNPYVPVEAIDNYGNSCLDLISEIDGNYYMSEPDGYLIVDFGGLDVGKGAKLVVRSGPQDIVPQGPPFVVKSPIDIQILNSSGYWHTVETIYSRVFWSTDIIDLSQDLPDAGGELKVRLYFVSNDRIDFIGLDTTKQGEFEVTYANLVSAIHSEFGDVKGMLMHSDNLYAELLPGEQITLNFTLPQNTEDIRDFVIIVEGHYFTIAA